MALLRCELVCEEADKTEPIIKLSALDFDPSIGIEITDSITGKSIAKVEMRGEGDIKTLYQFLGLHLKRLKEINDD